MQQRILVIIFFAVLFLTGFSKPELEHDKPQLKDEGIASPTIELQLMGVRLGTPYLKTKKQLTQKHGAPKSGTKNPVFDMFLLDKKTESILVIYPSEKDSSVVGTIQVSGTHPVESLDFFAEINLGDDERLIPLLFPRAIADPELTDGYRHYEIPFSNYSIEAKNKIVTALRVHDFYTTTFTHNGKSISLSQNLVYVAQRKGMLNSPIDVDKLTALADDLLRPHCKKRYPLRLASTGSPYIDVSMYHEENGWPNSVPATFLVDTGWSETTISEVLCKKLNCKDLKTRPPGSALGDLTRVVSGSKVGIGFTHTKRDYFKILPPVPTLKRLNIDGILGGNTLFARPLFINFKQGYLCFPQSPLPPIAERLKYNKIPAHHAILGTWSDIYVNHTLLKNYLLDSGAESSALVKKDVPLLNLKKSDAKTLSEAMSGVDSRPLHSFVEIGWPHLHMTQLLTVSEAARDADATGSTVHRVIGMDFLRHYIMSFDLDADYFYLGE